MVQIAMTHSREAIEIVEPYLLENGIKVLDHSWDLKTGGFMVLLLIGHKCVYPLTIEGSAISGSGLMVDLHDPKSLLTLVKFLRWWASLK